MTSLKNILVLAPFGVYPPRSGGHAAVLEPARHLARSGVDVRLFGLGIRKFEALRHLRSFERRLEPRLVEERHVSWWNALDYLRRGRTGLPPLQAAAYLRRRASAGLRARCEAADAVVCELPWLFDFASTHQPRLLVAHNVEADLVEANPRARASHLERAIKIEGRAWQDADAVICYTQEDRDRLARRYGPRPAEVIPLGVDTERIRPADRTARDRARTRLGVGDRFVVLFTGAWHLPNRAARDRMIAWAETLGQEYLLVVAGSVGPKPEQGRNWVVTGTLPSLEDWFRAADCCVNPVTEGSGANVKVLEYMAWGLPVVATPFGARGLDAREGEHLFVREVDQFPSTLKKLHGDPVLCDALGRAGRHHVEAERSWAALTGRRQALLEALVTEPASPCHAMP